MNTVYIYADGERRQSSSEEEGLTGSIVRAISSGTAAADHDDDDDDRPVVKRARGPRGRFRRDDGIDGGRNRSRTLSRTRLALSGAWRVAKDKEDHQAALTAGAGSVRQPYSATEGAIRRGGRVRADCGDAVASGAAGSWPRPCCRGTLDALARQAGAVCRQGRAIRLDDRAYEPRAAGCAGLAEQERAQERRRREEESGGDGGL